ncbi:alanine--tRNA ligase [Candidatus Azambacteria bacterium]|nr:alanine--tRNA ligase [Candidatus Azambacteria bacterium]
MMQNLTGDQIREKFLNFFQKNGHYVFPSASLLPEDKTVLFITAGMQPLVPYLVGREHPKGKRLASSQKCLRTDDILEVGDNRHLTFFEMLGNWSLGDYFKKEAILWSFELLTSKDNGFGIDPNKLSVTVFEGDENAPRDDEAINIWVEAFKSAGIQAGLGNKIYAYPKKKNWWGPVGDSGPCGPDTEIFYDTEKEHQRSFGEKCHVNCDCGKYVEIWNNVFMEYQKTKDGKYEPLAQKNVDTGMGLERIVMLLQNKPTVFETDLLWPIIGETIKQSGIPYEAQTHSYRIIADHLRASAFLIADGVLPSNTEQGYILRRLLRRAFRHAKMLNLRSYFYADLTKKISEIYKNRYPEISKKENEILTVMHDEEEKFSKALEKGLKYLKSWGEKNRAGTANAKNLSEEEIGDLIFYMYESHGFPMDDTLEEIRNMGWQFDIEKAKNIADEKFKKHQEVSRSGAEKKFGGHGLLLQTGELKAANEEELQKVTKLHTATHLLHEALRRVLGEHVMQKGSDITAERLRFDFSHPQKMTDEEKKKVEDMVNSEIQKGMEVKMEEMEYEKATQTGALGLFKDKYENKVKVYSVGAFSKELCGGPHVKNTSERGKFKILKEESSSAGIRRIKAAVL